MKQEPSAVRQGIPTVNGGEEVKDLYAAIERILAPLAEDIQLAYDEWAKKS